MIRVCVVFLFMLPQLVLFAQGWEARTDWPEDFPRPEETEELLFFIQRNRNENTIVYDINLNADGSLNKRNPIEVYWRRYHKHGGIWKKLSWLELTFAYGYRSRKRDGYYGIKLTAYNDREIKLTLQDGKWIPFLTINGQSCILKNLYVYADESKFWPSVKYVDIYGVNTSTQQLVKERIYNQ